MAVRRPLTLIAGRVKELPQGDTIVSGGFVPYEVSSGVTFVVPDQQQALFTLPIELLGTAILEVNGALVELA